MNETAIDDLDAVEHRPEKERRGLKVCFISPLGYGLYRPELQLPFGGAEVQFYQLANRLAADPSFDVIVLTTVRTEAGIERIGDLTLVRRRAQGRLDEGGPGRSFAWNRMLGYGHAFQEMLALLSRINADVYLHAGAGVEVGAYALVCRLIRRRFVFVVASSADLVEPFGQVRGFLKFLYPLGVCLADAVVCRSDQQIGWLRKRYGRQGVLIRTGHRIPETVMGMGRTVLWAGRVHPLKQPDLFLDVAEELPSARCTMIGMFDPCHTELFEHVRRRAARLPNLLWLENVALADMDPYFAQARVLVNTSQYEGFPNTFVQAAMYGVPVVSWKVDPDDTLSRRKIGVCAGGSFDRLVKSIREFWSSDERREEYGGRAREYATRHHDLEQSAVQLKGLVRSLVETSAGTVEIPPVS